MNLPLGAAIPLPAPSADGGERPPRTVDITYADGSAPLHQELPATSHTFRPPAVPGLVSVSEGSSRLVFAALAFGTLAEGDFSEAASFTEVHGNNERAPLGSRPVVPNDTLLLTALFLLFASWIYAQARAPRAVEAVP